MKEDVLEELMDEYLQTKGYFTRHNIKFRPRADHPDRISNQDSNHSDIDILGFNPLLKGPDRVWVVSCKSWQSGFKIESKLEEIRKNKKVSGREAWKGFRELIVPKWSEALLATVEEQTNTKVFTYVTAVTFFKGDRGLWENNQEFRAAMGGNPIRLIELDNILKELDPLITTIPASTMIGRIMQLMKASKKGKSDLITTLEKEES